MQRWIGIAVAPGAADALRHQERKMFLTQDWPQIAARIRSLGLVPEYLV